MLFDQVLEGLDPGTQKIMNEGGLYRAKGMLEGMLIALEADLPSFDRTPQNQEIVALVMVGMHLGAAHIMSSRGSVSEARTFTDMAVGLSLVGKELRGKL
jgi:hypothetical protein